MSRDHDWGCRLTLLVDTPDRDAVPQISGLLEQKLPESYRGFPVRFPVTWDPSHAHKIEVATVAGFAASRLGVDPTGDMSAVDWLLLTGQSVLEVATGPIFIDRTAELARVRATLHWYPPDVERYVLAAGWQRLSQQMPMVGRTAVRGDEVGSRLLSAQLAGDLMWLAFALSRQWPPYAKWRGAAFQALAIAADLARPLAACTTAPDWRDRESSLAEACEVLLSAQRGRGLPAPGSAVTRFWDRPFTPSMMRLPKRCQPTSPIRMSAGCQPGLDRSSSGPTMSMSLSAPSADGHCEPPTGPGPGSAERTRKRTHP